jgi:RNA recognition motif-containing protein
VSNIPPNATQEDVRQLFSEFGTVIDVYILKDHSGEPKGSGFVKFTETAEAKQAISRLHNQATLKVYYIILIYL